MAVTDEEDDRPWTAPPSRRYEPPILEPLPESLELILADQIYIARENLPPTLRNRLLSLAAFLTGNKGQVKYHGSGTGQLSRIQNFTERGPSRKRDLTVRYSGRKPRQPFPVLFFLQ